MPTDCRFRAFALLPLLAFAASACAEPGPAVSTTVDLDPRFELKAPFAPAHLSKNTFRMFSSADDGSIDVHPVVSTGNMDFGVFERDCRQPPLHDPIHLTVRSGAGCPEGVEGLVLAHATGPGLVSRIWLTARDIFTDEQWQNERLRIHVDGVTHPLVDISLLEAASGAWPFVPPLGGERSGSLVTYEPIPFENGIWITLGAARTKLYYYQVDVVNGRFPDPSSFATDWGELAAPKSVTAHSILHEGAGEGGVSTIRLHARPGAEESLRQARLSFSFDGITSSASVGDLCASGFGWGHLADPDGRIIVQPGEAGGITCTLRWGWPYERHGRIALRVTEPTGVEAAIATSVPDTPLPRGRFFVYSATHTTAVPRLLTWADVEGEGRLAGLVLSAEGAPDPEFLFPDAFNFLEGDEVLTIDGEVRARGTGTEDLFNGGFYFKDGPYSWPWGGVSLVEKTAAGHGRAQMTRSFLGWDQINFKQSFHATLEIGGDRPDHEHDYRSVAILYRKARSAGSNQVTRRAQPLN